MHSKFARFLSIVIASAAFVNAVPNVNGTLEARSAQVDGHLFVCTDAGFTGQCANIAFNVVQCINFNSPFQDSISSFGPDNGFICVTYTDANCRGQTFIGSNPGFNSLPGGINDELSSFQCFSLAC